MSIILAGLLRLLSPDLDTAHAAVVTTLPAAAQCDRPIRRQAYDCPERARWALTAIADRETGYAPNMRWFGRHPDDSKHERVVWNIGRDRGVLEPWCPAHDSPVGMSTVGPHGMMYVFNVHRLRVPGNCVPWWLFATPGISAIAALDRYLHNCDDADAGGWCPSTAAIRRALRRRCVRNDFHGPACREVV